MKKILCGIVLSFACVQAAEATGTYYVDSTTGNDANNCTSASTACLTVAGAKILITALADPSNTTVKLNGTFIDQVAFSKIDVVAPDTLDGLHITATDKSNQPTINTAVAATTAVLVSGINHVTIDHLTITGGTAGIDVHGDSVTYVTDGAIHHNSISGMADDESSSGIRLLYAKKSDLYNNTVHDVAISLADIGNSTYFYGIYLQNIHDSSIRQNTISATGVTDVFSAAGGHSTYIYGIYASSVAETSIADNTITDVYATETSNVTATYHYLYVEGISANSTVDTVIEDNTIQDITSTIAADIDSNTGSAYSYGIYLNEMRSDDSSTAVQNNSIDNITATTASKSGSANSQGINFLYGFSVVVNNNTIENVTASHSSVLAGAATVAYVTGMYTAYFGNAVTVNQNTISTLTANVSYSGADASGNVSVQGIYSFGGQVTISKNVIQHLSWSINNANIDSFYDNAASYGISLNYASSGIIKNNRIRDISNSYSAGGADGSAYLNSVGINVGGSDNVSILKNRITDLDFSAAVSDPTDASYLNVTSYGMFLFRMNNANVSGNRLNRISSSGDAGNANTMFHYIYGIYMNTVGGIVSSNRVANYSITSAVANGGINQLFYAMQLSTQSTAAVTNNLIRDITTTTTGATSSHQDAGMFIVYAPNLVLEGNEIRPFTSTSANGNHTMYGINFGSDASKTRMIDNIVLGDVNFVGTSQIGLYLPSDSTLDIDIIHNTVANWKYPIQVEGGSKVYLRNNILSAVGADSYALGVGRNEVNNDTFKSDYNLLYNATVADQLVYDTDNTLAILLADWTNVGGSWGYDINSINKPPKLNATGRLEKGSKAINVGSKDYPYNAGDTELTYLATDINGDNRPLLAKKKQVDIGADEYKK